MRFFLLIVLLMADSGLLPAQSLAEERLIAVILTRDLPRYRSIHAAFLENLEHPEALRVYVQTPNEDNLSLRNSARKAVAIDADLIITYGALATRAAQAESFKTPIIYADVHDPLVQGIIPGQFTIGRNATGIRGDSPIQTLLKHFSMATGAKQIVALYHADDMAAENLVDSLQRIAPNKDLKIFPLAKHASITVAELFGRMPDGTQGIYCVDSIPLLEDLPQIMQLAAERKVPVISRTAGLAEQGALMVLESDPVEQGEKLAGYVNCLMDGQPLAELPPERPRKVALVVNMQTARALDIQIPFEILALTSRLIR